MFEATLKNRSSAHFAPVTITFPIPEDQYEQAILALKKSQIGDAGVQDCLIDNVRAVNYPALVRMTGTMANVDELDWLGKQLESFDRYELLQFISHWSVGYISSTAMRSSLQMLKRIWTASAKNCRMRQQLVSGSARSRRSQLSARQWMISCMTSMARKTRATKKIII